MGKRKLADVADREADGLLRQLRTAEITGKLSSKELSDSERATLELEFFNMSDNQWLI